jgi:hypothetical protein
LNGKVERSHRVDDQEFYQLLDRDGISDDIHLLTTSFGSGRTTTMTTGRTGLSVDRPRTNASWQKLEPECHRGPENLHGISGAGGRTRTDDLLITNQLLYQLSYAGR